MPPHYPSAYTVELQSNQELDVKTKYKEKLGNFQPIGRIRSMHSQYEPYDIFEVIEAMSKSAIKIFNQMKSNRDLITNITNLPKDKNSTKSQDVLRSRYLKELQKLDIAQKIKTYNHQGTINKNTFMINPYYIKCFGHQKAIIAWEDLYIQ